MTMAVRSFPKYISEGTTVLGSINGCFPAIISKLLSVVTVGLIAFKAEAYFPFANIKSSSLNIFELLLIVSILS